MDSYYKIQKIHLYAFCIIIVAAILVYISYEQWDEPISLYTKEHQLGQYLVFKFFIRFPELFVMTAFLILLGLIGHCIIWPYYTPLKQKLLAYSIGLMAAYTLKDIFKFLFSRISFHFFQGGYNLGSFPSGHTTIPFFVAGFLWFWLPVTRPVLFIIPMLVAIGLLATNSHYLADIIGGAALGLIIGFYAYYFSEISNKPSS